MTVICKNKHISKFEKGMAFWIKWSNIEEYVKSVNMTVRTSKLSSPVFLINQYRGFIIKHFMQCVSFVLWVLILYLFFWARFFKIWFFSRTNISFCIKTGLIMHGVVGLISLPLTILDKYQKHVLVLIGCRVACFKNKRANSPKAHT